MKVPQEILLEKLDALNDLVVKVNLLDSNQKRIYISSLPGSLRQLLIDSLSKKEKHILILCSNLQSLNETKVELSILGLEELLVSTDDFSDDSFQERLTDLTKKERFILISTYDLLKRKLPSKKSIDKNTTIIEIGGNLGYDELIEYLNTINYNSDKYVDTPGDYSVRGSIIDFWSYSEKHPVRLEYDGDFIESIRHFDPETQRSLDKITSVSVAASIENNIENLDGDIFDYLDKPLIFSNLFELEKLYADADKREEITEFENDLDEELKIELLEREGSFKTVEQGEIVVPNTEINSLEKLFSKNARWIIEDEIGKNADRLQLNFIEAPPINSNFELLFNLLKNYSTKNHEIIIAVENELQSRRLYELLSDFHKELEELFETGEIKIIVLALKSGFISRDSNLLLLTDYQIFNKPYRTKLSQKLKYKRSKTRDFASIKRGDFVVHENFGIGKYSGLETIKIGEVEQESIKILYAEGGVVYVNLNYLSLVKKFSSRDNAPPRLSVLGSGEWKSTKKKVKEKIKDAARDLITLYAKRKSSVGFSFSPDSIWQKELEASFFYEDTPDQTKVTDEVKRDMESENPMDRLVCGDVGFGKTEIAVRASFKAINDSKQAAMLVPTTILAEQHYNTFKDRLTQFPVKVEVISRFQSQARQKEIVKKLTEGQVDLIIGTHRLLSKDIQFKDLGLLIIDEEHRFGVMAKEKLRAFKTNVDTLTLTATPIPRTLNLSLLGARDLSIIATPPLNRQPIYTKVDTFDIHRIREWVLNEVKRKGQIYFVHDRIQSIDKIAAYIQKHIPEINIGVAHGQMKPAQLEKVIYDFLNRYYHMLISTKIIESGIDIPNVNTIIVNRADRFGLAELHQIRGRVGRSNRQAYAYFLVPSLHSITKKAIKRLQAIEEYTDLGEGFNLSMRDLEIRGAGNLLGTEQSGFIDTIGFNMYMKLLDEAVDELKQNEFKDLFSRRDVRMSRRDGFPDSFEGFPKDLLKHQERSEPTIDTYFEIGIPHSYMPDQSDRLSFYTALFSMVKSDEVDELREEMEDRFGKIPLNVDRLISAAVLKYYASFAQLERIVVQRDKLILVLPRGDREDFYKNKFVPLLDFLNKNFNDVKFVQNKETLKLEVKNRFIKPEEVLEFLINLCKEIIEVIKKY